MKESTTTKRVFVLFQCELNIEKDKKIVVVEQTTYSSNIHKPNHKVSV